MFFCMRFISFFVAVVAASTIGAPALAVCVYNGELYAKTTFNQEYQDSKWVVRATVVGQSRGDDDELPWVAYKLKISSSFKGNPPEAMMFYTERNSGAFYLEPPYDESAIDEDYLLFLNPNEPDPDGPAESKGSVFVNYSCGQSKLWSEVTANEKSALEHLSGR
jgi:hypothetical protein